MKDTLGGAWNRLSLLRWISISLGLILLIWMVYGQTVRFDFINCDDDIFVYQNPLVLQGFSCATVGRVLTSIRDTFYYPLTILSFMADAENYGMNPAGFHLTNVFLHAGSVFLLFGLLVRLTGQFWKSAVIAALFAIHPLQVEAVAWVTARKDVLSGLFFMLTLHAYISYVRKPFSWIYYSAVFLLFFLGLLAKPMLVTLPCLLLLLDWWPLKRFESQRGRILLEKIPLFVLSAVFSVIPFFAQSSVGSETPVVQPSLWWRMGNAVVSTAVYIRQTFIPTGLGMPYPKYDLHGGVLLVSLAVLLILSCVVVFCRKKWPALLFGWLWYLGMLLPVSGAVRFLGVARADRFVYLPCIGLFILIGWGVSLLPIPKKQGRLAAGVILVLFAVAAHSQVSYWRNNMTLWARSLEVTGPSAIAYVNLGVAFAKANELESAEVCFQRTLQLDPNDQEALYNLGLLRIQNNRMAEGEVYLLRVLAINPDRFDANRTLGATYIIQGKIEAGIERTLTALRARPEDADTKKNLEEARRLLAEQAR
jgi:hypothetical protein